MDGTTFDSLVKRIATTRVNRLTALRGLAAGAVASITGLTLLGQEGEAKKGGKKTRRRRICHRTSASDPGVSKKLKAKRAKRHLKQHPFDTKGRCAAAPAPVTPVIPATTCDASAPVRCGNSAFCCPSNLPQCCVRADIAGFSCAPSGFECCGQFGVACAPGSEQCCEGANDPYTSFEFEQPYCAGAGQECCPWDFEDGACGPNEKCCPPDLEVGGNQRPGCVPEDAVCCPTLGGLSAQAHESTGAFCGRRDFCCPPDAGTDFGRCCPLTLLGTVEGGGCCNRDAVNPSAACPTGFGCNEIGCCLPLGG